MGQSSATGVGDHSSGVALPEGRIGEWDPLMATLGEMKGWVSSLSCAEMDLANSWLSGRYQFSGAIRDAKGSVVDSLTPSEKFMYNRYIRILDVSRRWRTMTDRLGANRHFPGRLYYLEKATTYAVVAAFAELRQLEATVPFTAAYEEALTLVEGCRGAERLAELAIAMAPGFTGSFADLCHLYGMLDGEALAAR